MAQITHRQRRVLATVATLATLIDAGAVAAQTAAAGDGGAIDSNPPSDMNAPGHCRDLMAFWTAEPPRQLSGEKPTTELPISCPSMGVICGG
jgi:hypothetical protein